MKPYYLLKFETDLNKEVSVKIGNANTELDPSFIQACMSDLISSDPFDTGKGALSTAKQAQLIHYSIRQIAM